VQAATQPLLQGPSSDCPELSFGSP
jgi:hypothetical protein